MNRPKDPLREERNKTICEAFINRESVDRLAARFSLSPSGIIRILKEAGITSEMRVGEPKPRIAGSKKPTFSQLHVRLGAEISYHRTFELKMTATAFATAVNISVKRLVEIEAGTYDASLGELVRIAGEIKKPLEQLLAGRSVVVVGKGEQLRGAA